jgi:hypothetical protein
MPYKIIKYQNGWNVKNIKTGKLQRKKSHKTKKQALKHLKALYANVKESTTFDDNYNNIMKSVLQ